MAVSVGFENLEYLEEQKLKGLIVLILVLKPLSYRHMDISFKDMSCASLGNTMCFLCHFLLSDYFGYFVQYLLLVHISNWFNYSSWKLSLRLLCS